MILVTGCAGFIGSKIAALLLKRGDTVVGIDNLNNAYATQLKDWRLVQLQRFSNLLPPFANFRCAKLQNTSHIERFPIRQGN